MEQVPRLSLRTIANPGQPSVEIIAVASPSDHADQLNEAWKSWTAPNGRNWLRYLPDEHLNARVVFFSSAVRERDLEHPEHIIDTVARRLLSRVIRARENDGVQEDTPIIFVAHSLGAFVVKSALLFASRARHRGFRTIYNQATRIVFLAAPHVWRDASQNIGELASAIAKASPVPSSAAFHEALADGGEMLQEINEDFIELNQDAPLEIFNFAETMPSPNWRCGHEVILDLPSSSLPVDVEDEEDELFEDATPLKKAHFLICTFGSRADEDYKKVIATLKRHQPRQKRRNHPYPPRRLTNLSESSPDLYTPPSSYRPPRPGKEGKETREPDPERQSLKDRIKDTARGLADILEPLSVIAPIIIGGGRQIYKWNRARNSSKGPKKSASKASHSRSHRASNHDAHRSPSRGRPREHSPTAARLPRRHPTGRPHSWHDRVPNSSHVSPPPRWHPYIHHSPSRAHAEAHHAPREYRTASQHRPHLSGSVPMSRVHSDSGPRRF